MTHDEHMDAAAAASLDNVIDVTDMFSGWRAKLIKNDDKKPKACLANILTALRHAPEWKAVLRYDAFAYRIVLAAAPPWATLRTEWLTRPWTDDDDCRTAEWMQRHGIMARLTEVGPAITSVAREHSYHPVREYLDGLPLGLLRASRHRYAEIVRGNAYTVHIGRVPLHLDCCCRAHQ